MENNCNVTIPHLEFVQIKTLSNYLYWIIVELVMEIEYQRPIGVSYWCFIWIDVEKSTLHSKK